MSITKVSNSSLARHCSLDASFISRIRRGKRNIVSDAPYLRQMAAYLIRGIKTQLQKDSVVALLKKPLDFTDSKQLQEEVYKWFVEENKINSIDNALDNFKNSSFSFTSNDKYTQEDLYKSGALIGYSKQGKREIVIKFLKTVLEYNQPTNLYLYSDENMDWLTEDKAYLDLWASLMIKIIKKGNKIKIIHTIERNFDEMINAIMQWVPMYLTGAIEPYYYPKRRDGVLSRTLFIASNIAVVSSSSINQTKAANFYFEDKAVINSFEEEYNNLLSQCKPLMKIFNQDEFSSFLEILNEFESEQSQTYIKSLNFSALTIPESILKRLHIKEVITKEELNQIINRKDKANKLLETNNFYHAITLPEINSEFQFTFDLIREDSLLHYTYSKEDLIFQLKELIELIETCENFNVVINKRENNPFILYVKEGVGLIIIKAVSPMIAFAVNESNLTAAFVDYFQRSFLKDLNRKKTLDELQKYLISLDNSCSMCQKT